MSRAAKAQKEVEWFKAVRADPSKLKIALENFRKNKQEALEAGKKRARWSVARAKEEMIPFE